MICKIECVIYICKIYFVRDELVRHSSTLVYCVVFCMLLMCRCPCIVIDGTVASANLVDRPTVGYQGEKKM